jgi:sugar phosphate isomerase/epimerase
MTENEKRTLSLLDRRHFLKMAGLGILGTTLPAGFTSCANSNRAGSLPGLSMQLYTVRNEIAADLTGTLRRLAEIGFTHVETAFWPEGVSHRDGAAYLKEAGLGVSSIHAELEEEPGMMKELAEIYECDRLIWHGWPEDPRYQTREGTLELASQYNKLSDYLKANGLRFGLHNHWWEFRTLDEGITPWELLHQELNREIFFQLDIYWVTVAGLNPASIIRQIGSRVEMLHVKDGPANPDDVSADEPHEPMTAVGKGRLDIPEIMKSAREHVQWMVLEMDETAGDPFTLLDQSLQYMLSNRFAALT